MLTHRHAQRWLSLLLVTVLAATGLVLVQSVQNPTPANAVTGKDFNPGNIISDEQFHDTNSLSASEIQNFLNNSVTYCSPSATCLKNYVQTTSTKTANAYCKQYQGVANERAAAIIYKSAQACGISPKVLMVLIQKESTLITNSSPTAAQYRAATGYGCPDYQGCDANYYGFFNQVFNAAQRFKYYEANVNSFNYRPGRLNYIQYHPDTSCGGSMVYIENQATANLYIYTPYQPNAAALANLTGTGDSCSAYGNRNFWRIFYQWFGSPQAPVGFQVSGAIGNKYYSVGGKNGFLGSPTTQEYPGLPSGGAWQGFQGGMIHWSPATDAHITKGGIQTAWAAVQYERGVLKYPTHDEACGLRNNGCTQLFQGGVIAWSAQTGAHPTSGGIGNAWKAQGWENGKLGYPSNSEYSLQNGRAQQFQGGLIAWSSSTGADPILGGILSAWKAHGAETGKLGYPFYGEACGLRNNGCTQLFQGGVIAWSAQTGAHPTSGGIGNAWKAQGWENGKLGYPTGAEYSINGGRAQNFQGGTLVWSSQTQKVTQL